MQAFALRHSRTRHQRYLCVDFKRANLILDLGFLFVPYDSQVILRLKIEPKVGSHAERVSEPESHFRRDSALLVDDIVDGRRRNVQSQRQLIAGEMKRRHELFPQDLARMNWFQACHGSSLSDNP
jgi:hypothetical protein